MDRACGQGWGTVIAKKHKEMGSRRGALEIAETVLEHRLSDNTLGSTNVKGKL